MSWVTLISDEEEKAKFDGHINNFAEHFASRNLKHSGLLCGQAGLCLFWKYLALYSKKDEHLEYYHKSLENILGSVETKPMSYNLSNGVAGILWTVEHLNSCGHLPQKYKHKIGDDIDEFLAECSLADMGRGAFDFLHAGLGTMLFFLERAEKNNCKKIINCLVSKLGEIAQQFPEGVAWPSVSPLRVNSGPIYDLGLAHGIAGIIILLSKVIEKGIAVDYAGQLLYNAVQWLQSKEQKNSLNGHYPPMVPIQVPFSNRVAWCYGDLGVAVALLEAAKQTQNISWKQQAINIALNVTKRRHPECRIQDTAICHGSAGVAHIFNRLYNSTGEYEFKLAARYWFGITLEMYGTHGHFKSFLRFRNADRQVYKYRSGLLEGLSGIGLTFLSAASDIEPKWDRCLLLS